MDFHPLGQGRDVWDNVTPQKAFCDLHRLPSYVCVARACALTCQIAPQKALAPRKALSVNPWSCDHRPRDASAHGCGRGARQVPWFIVSQFHSFPSDPEGPRGKVLRFHSFTVSPADERASLESAPR